MTARAETGGTTVAEEEPVQCVCGRLLADPVSKARGLGPVCFRRLYGRSGGRVRNSRVPATTHSTVDQLAFELDDEDEPDWTEPCGDIEPDDDWDDRTRTRPSRDLWGQGLHTRRLHTIQLTGSYL